MIEAILFDFDMTLVNSRQFVNKSIYDLKEHGLECNMTEREIWSTPHIPLMKKISEMNNYKHSWENINEWTKEARHEYYGTSVINDLNELIEIKNKGIYFGLISNNAREIVDEVLAKNGNEKLKFEDVFGNEDLKNHNSKSELIQFVVDKYRFDKKKVMYVGDSDKDMISAKEVGVIPVGVLLGLHNSKELKKAGAEIIIRQLKEIRDYIKNY